MSITDLFLIVATLFLLYTIFMTLIRPHVHHLKYVNPDGVRVQLVNNPNAIDQTFDKVKTFILNDPTNTKAYIPGKFVCSNFAEIIHNNAEVAGIRCAWVAVDFENGVPSHSCNAFNTVDKGIVFIDCTGTLNPQPGSKPDFIVDVRIGRLYEPIAINPASGLSCPPMGTIKDFSLYW